MTGPLFDQITLNLRKYAAQHRISGQMLEDMRLDTRQDHTDFFNDRLVIALVTRVQCVNLPPETVTKTSTTSFATPATWWQHLKHTISAKHGLGWINRQWPTRMAIEERTLVVTVDLRRFHVYPNAPRIPHDGYRLAVPNHELSTSVTWITGEERQ